MNYGFPHLRTYQGVPKGPFLWSMANPFAQTRILSFNRLIAHGPSRNYLCIPSLLCRSLEKQLIPCYNFLTSVLSFDEKGSSRIFKQCVEKKIPPRMVVLRGAGERSRGASVHYLVYAVLFPYHSDSWVMRVKNLKKVPIRLSEWGSIQVKRHSFMQSKYGIAPNAWLNIGAGIDVFLRLGLSNDDGGIQITTAVCVFFRGQNYGNNGRLFG